MIFTVAMDTFWSKIKFGINNNNDLHFFNGKKSYFKLFVSCFLFFILTMSSPSSLNAQGVFDEDKMFNRPEADSPYPTRLLDNYNGTTYQYYNYSTHSHQVTPYNIADVRDRCINYEQIPRSLIDRFDVTAMQLDIMYNKYGQRDPNGAMFVLNENIGKVKNESQLNSKIMEEISIIKDLKNNKSSPAYLMHVNEYKNLLNSKTKYKSYIEPLTIRTNVGKCVEIHLQNELNVTASIHPTGVTYDPNKSDGLVVGNNNSTVVPPGQSFVYRWFPEAEGSYFFTDGARQYSPLEKIAINSSDVKNHGLKSSNAKVENIEQKILNPKGINEENDGNTKAVESSLRQHGLFGALIVEPEGAWWSDPLSTYANSILPSGVKADIHFPDGVRNDSREFVVFYHDGATIKNTVAKSLSDKEKKEQEKILVPSRIYNFTEKGSLYTINYRGDSVEERTHEGDWLKCPLCHEEQYFYSSWVHGDPGMGDLVFPGYVGDPVKFITIGAQVEENHVHHLHNHRWKSDSSSNWSNTIDSQPINPGNANINPFHVSFGNTNKHNTHALPGGDFSVNPSMTYEQSLKMGGLGYAHHNTGDVLFHCHLFPHYGSGMWGMMRAYDKLQNNTFGESNGIVLQPLPDHSSPPMPSDDQPGFPKFIGYPINSTYSGNYTEELAARGQPVPHPPDPNGNIDGRNYSKLEILASKYFANLNQTEGNRISQDEIIKQAIANSKPGAPMVDPCPTNATERHYDVEIASKDLVYNKYGDHDPYGRIFVISNDTSAKQRGYDGPLILRGNLGECVTVTLKNNLTDDLKHNRDNNADGIPDGLPISMHIHFVAFDVLGSDGTVVGYDYDEGTYPQDYAQLRHDKLGLNTTAPNYQNKIDYRYYYDEQGNVFFHDHNSGIIKGMHGTGGILVIEPKNSTWYDGNIYKNKTTKTLWKLSGDKIHGENKIVNSSTGHNVIVKPGNGNEPFREYVMFYQDFVELYDKKGVPINFKEKGLHDHMFYNLGAPMAESFHDHGSMSINYKNEPLYQRYVNNSNNQDPSKIFSSVVYGDPSTPIIQSYPGEKVLVRLIQTGHEEMHNFNMHGFSWPKEINNPYSENVSSQPLSVSEQFSFISKTKPVSEVINDHLYSSYSIDDLWDGMWGINRIWCNPLVASKVNETGMVSDIPIPLKNASEYPVCIPLAKIRDVLKEQNNVDNNASALFGNISNTLVKNKTNTSFDGSNLADLIKAKTFTLKQLNELTNSTNTAELNSLVEKDPKLNQLAQNTLLSIQKLNSTINTLNSDPVLKANNVTFSRLNITSNSFINQYSPNSTTSIPIPIIEKGAKNGTMMVQANRTVVGLISNGSDVGASFQNVIKSIIKNNYTLIPLDQIKTIDHVHPDLVKNIDILKIDNNNNTTTVPTCPPDVLRDSNKVISFDITAINSKIKYNKYGDYDNNGVIYVLSKDKDKDKKVNAENGQIDPLVIRANKGQCIILNIKNDISVSNTKTDNIRYRYSEPFLPNECQPHLTDTHIQTNTVTHSKNLFPGSCFPPKEWKHSDRISIHPNTINYNVLWSDGTNVGYNFIENTAGPGETATYVYYANKTGTVILNDMADFKSNRHHGAYGLLIVEPEGSKYYNDKMLKNKFDGNETSTPEAYVEYSSKDGKTKNFHEYALLLADGVAIDRTDNLCPIDIDAEETANISCNQSPLDDPEEQGFFGINYKSEPLKWRLIEDVNYHNGKDSPYAIEFSKARNENASIIPEDRISLLFSTRLGNHSDPATPLINTTQGENVVLRIADVADKPRGFTLHLGGHLFLMPSPLAYDLPFGDDASKHGMLGRDSVDLEEGITPALNVGKAVDVELVGGAGGPQNKTGDYVYEDMKLTRFVEGGVWGILRVNNGTSTSAFTTIIS